jgi:hypothetical protein
MNTTSPPKLRRFPAAKQRRLDELLEKNSEGTITPRQKARLEQLVAEAERLMVANGKRLARFARRKGTRAIPVTVWVQPAQAE